MSATRNAPIVAALDSALAEVRRAGRAPDARAVDSQLTALAARLEVLRDDAAAGHAPDAAAFGALVRETGTWALDRHLHILGALGGVVRTLPRA